jgi:hydroxyacylglutathione hydrolase
VEGLVQVVTIEVPELGNRCHLVHDGVRALVVDPPRDLAPLERTAEDAGVDIAAMADTHVHGDYLSGAALLTARHGCRTSCPPRSGSR